MTSGWFSMSQVRLEADTWINTYKKENCGRCDAFWTGQSLKWRWTQEFPVCPVVRTQRFCCWGPGSIPDQGTKIPQVIRGGQKKKKKQTCLLTQVLFWSCFLFQYKKWVRFRSYTHTHTPNKQNCRFQCKPKVLSQNKRLRGMSQQWSFPPCLAYGSFMSLFLANLT